MAILTALSGEPNLLSLAAGALPMGTTAITAEASRFSIFRSRTHFFGLTSDECIKVFFGGNAFVAVLVLALITIFLFREGFDFFHEQQVNNLTVYRRAGLEFVDIARQEETDYTALSRYLSALRLQSLTELTQKEHLTPAQANARLSGFDAFAGSLDDAIEPVRSMLSDWTDSATSLKTRFGIIVEREGQRKQLLGSGKVDEAAKVQIETIDLARELKPLLDSRPAFIEANHHFAQAAETALATLPTAPTPALQTKLARYAQLSRDFLNTLPRTEQKLEAWDYKKPIPFYATFTAFLFGRDWLTASFWQDRYGVLPLFVGSLMVSFVALVLAVPLGVGSAIYVSQVARPSEARIIKPAIEFISAFPSVVLGFFGVVVWGEVIRTLSHVSWLQWLPGFPIAERLNVLTAGCLLALIAIPTIFTLAEDAIHNVPKSFKEASYALGAGRFQTIVRITLPASLSGIVSAVLLGFGRVIGETMVVLLCAGNRIEIPDFTKGLAAFTQPVHTMTGIIAQEMGEVVGGSLQYRALFMVGIVLFFLSLFINYLAQKVVRRYHIAAV